MVAVAGDVFDSATPSADSYTVLASTLRKLRDTGAEVVLTSGNHDSATRSASNPSGQGWPGIHVVTRHDQFREPITFRDEHGPGALLRHPVLEPALIRHHYPAGT